MVYKYITLTNIKFILIVVLNYSKICLKTINIVQIIKTDHRAVGLFPTSDNYVSFKSSKFTINDLYFDLNLNPHSFNKPVRFKSENVLKLTDFLKNVKNTFFKENIFNERNCYLFRSSF